MYVCLFVCMYFVVSSRIIIVLVTDEPEHIVT